jgi:DNA-binding NarL/FixJ family response regulator
MSTPNAIHKRLKGAPREATDSALRKIVVTSHSLPTLTLMNGDRCRPRASPEGFLPMWDQYPVESLQASACQPFENNGDARSGRIRLLIVDDQPVFQEGLNTILAAQPDMVVVGNVGTFPEAVAEFRRNSPDVTLLNPRLQGAMLGMDLLIGIRAEFPGARVIMLTHAEGDAEIQRALRSGASSYVLKSTPKNELLETIRSTHRGRSYIPPAVAARLAEHLGKEDLTAREIQVLRLIRDGNRNKQIAGRLSIAETTVNFHIKNLVGKLQANDRAHAVIIAIRRGLLTI